MKSEQRTLMVVKTAAKVVVGGLVVAHLVLQGVWVDSRNKTMHTPANRAAS